MAAMRLAMELIFEDSSDEEEEQPRRPRIMQERKDYFHELDDIDFTRRFRLPKGLCLQVLEIIEHRLEFPSDKNGSVAPINQLLLCLRFYATGCTQLSAADFSGVSTSTAHRVIHRVSDAIASLYRQFIYMPRTAAEIRETQLGFYQIARFPRVIGSVDCTHIKIVSPGGEQAKLFRNRKGWYSLQCQAIVNSNLEFLDVVARWPGSTHDQTVFDNSTVRAKFEMMEFGDSFLLGDSAYSNRPYFMIPLGNPQSPQEVLFNESQIRTRNPVERSFGVLNRRFPVLALGIRTKLDKVQKVVIACAVLHNILRRGGEPEEPPANVNFELPMPWEELIRDRNEANHNRPRGGITGVDPARQELIANYFADLSNVFGNNR